MNQSVNWDGFDCTGVYELLGHWDWAHAKAILIIKNQDGLAFIPKGESLTLDISGNAISKIPINDVDTTVVASAQKRFGS